MLLVREININIYKNCYTYKVYCCIYIYLKMYKSLINKNSKSSTIEPRVKKTISKHKSKLEIPVNNFS